MDQAHVLRNWALVSSLGGSSTKFLRDAMGLCVILWGMVEMVLLERIFQALLKLSVAIVATVAALIINEPRLI